MTAALELVPEFNEWMQLVPMPPAFRARLCWAMATDLFGCWAIEVAAYRLFFGRASRKSTLKAKTE